MSTRLDPVSRFPMAINVALKGWDRVKGACRRAEALGDQRSSAMLLTLEWNRTGEWKGLEHTRWLPRIVIVAVAILARRYIICWRGFIKVLYCYFAERLIEDRCVWRSSLYLLAISGAIYFRSRFCFLFKTIRWWIRAGRINIELTKNWILRS